MTFHLAVFTLAPCEAALPFRPRDTQHSFKKKTVISVKDKDT